MAFVAFKAVEKVEACGDMFTSQWVDQQQGGVVKSRFTVVEANSKNPNVK